MAGRDHEQAPNAPDVERNRLAREIDAALARYSAVEPRAGLEERVLANLRAEQVRGPNHAWWRWSVAVALAAVVVAAMVVGWRSAKPPRPVMVNHPSTPAPGANELRTNVAANGGVKQLRPSRQASQRPTTRRRPQIAVVAAVTPKLDQFPSPQPLSEQEQILATYVAQFHRQAALIARVANEELQRDRAELIDKPQGPGGQSGFGEQATTNR